MNLNFRKMDNIEKYVRQIALEGFCEVGQEKLANASICLVGVGGVGGAALQLITSMGVGKIVVFDNDKISLNNLHRQTIYTEKFVGEPKASVAAKFAKERNSNCNVESVSALFDASYLTSHNFDIIIDATDSFESRMSIAKAARKYGVRVISASAEGFVSQNFLFGDAFYMDDIVKNESGCKSEVVAIFPPAAFLSGSWAAGEAVKSIVYDTYEVGAFRMLDQLSMKYFSGNLR